MVRAFDAARARNAAQIAWPDSVPEDSLEVRLTLDEGSFWDAQPAMMQLGERPHTAVFSIPRPTLTPATPYGDQGAPDYPSANRKKGASGKVLMRFVADTIGNVERSTIHDVWPPNTPRPMGEELDFYNNFVASAKNWIKVFDWSQHVSANVPCARSFRFRSTSDSGRRSVSHVLQPRSRFNDDVPQSCVQKRDVHDRDPR